MENTRTYMENYIDLLKKQNKELVDTLEYVVKQDRDNYELISIIGKQIHQNNRQIYYLELKIDVMNLPKED